MESEVITLPKKRIPNHGKFSKNHKKLRPNSGDTLKFKKPNQKMMKLFKKRARAYNSDEDEVTEDAMENSSGEEDQAELHDSKYNSGSENEEEGEGYGIQQGVTKFTEGCRAFRAAFVSIMKKNLMNDPLGPVLSAHKKLVAEKLAEEETKHKSKSTVKMEKHMAAERGHVKPSGFIDAKEKLLISVATKGVVKLFNAVNKSQNPQKGLNPSKSKDSKALAKKRQKTFLSELKKPTSTSTFNSSKISQLNKENDEEPEWAPLRDSYMLTSLKFKDWDKMADPASIGGLKNMPLDESSSDQD